jgi:hypothetical protein
MTYTTNGSVCGSCGHAHRTIAAAVRCIQKHQRDIESANGSRSYSDRAVWRTDGEPLTDDEIEAMHDAMDEWADHE